MSCCCWIELKLCKLVADIISPAVFPLKAVNSVELFVLLIEFALKSLIAVFKFPKFLKYVLLKKYVACAFYMRYNQCQKRRNYSMLMECYECGKKISSRAERCTNCGFPVAETDFTKYCNVNGILYDFSMILKQLSKEGETSSENITGLIRALIARKTGMEWTECQHLADIICSSGCLPKSYEGKMDIFSGRKNER